jgi:DNA primase
MRFNSSFVDQIKSSVDIVRVIADYVRLRKAGSNYIGLCPFHSEKTPSFNVHVGRQYYKCFGCDAKGDVIMFIQSIERISFPEAVKFLAERFGIPLPKTALDTEFDEAAQERVKLLEIHDRAARFFADLLHRSREGRQASDYLRERGISIQTIKQFDMGVAQAAPDGLYRHLNEQSSTELLLKSGLVLSSDFDSRCYDRFRKRVMFPIRSEGGKVIAFGGRILGEGQPKYLNSPETVIYSKSRTLYGLFQAREVIRRKNFAILVEGYMDCIALHQAGIENAVASCGTSLTDLQARLLARFTDRIVVNFDPDSAGAAAALRSLSIFLENGFRVRVLALPGGDDPDAFIRKKGAREYLQLLEAAPQYFDYLLEKAQAGYNLRTVEGKVGAVASILPYLARTSNRIERMELLKQAAEVFGIEESLIREELKNIKNENREPSALRDAILRVDLKSSEKYLLKAILEDESIAAKVLPELAASGDHLGLQSEGIFQAIIALYTEQGRIDVAQLQDRLRSEEDRHFLSQALFAPLNPMEALRCVEAIRRQKTEHEIALLQKQIQQAENARDYELLANLHTRKTQLKKTTAR